MGVFRTRHCTSLYHMLGHFSAEFPLHRPGLIDQCLWFTYLKYSEGAKPWIQILKTSRKEKATHDEIVHITCSYPKIITLSSEEERTLLLLPTYFADSWWFWSRSINEHLLTCYIFLHQKMLRHQWFPWTRPLLEMTPRGLSDCRFVWGKKAAPFQPSINRHCPFQNGVCKYIYI